MAPILLQSEAVVGALASISELAVRLDGHAQNTPLGPSLAYTAAGGVTGGLMLATMVWAQHWPDGSKVPSESDSLVVGESGNWGPAQPRINTASVSAGIATLATTICMALPSILGSWCWPLLLVTLFGAKRHVASDNNREAAHHFTWGADIVLFGGLIWYAISLMPNTLPRKSYTGMVTGLHRLIYRAVICMVAIGSILTLIDPTRHVLLDHGGGPFKPEDLSMYADYPNLSPTGHFCRASTITGLICMVVGIAWTIQLPAKLSKL